MKRFDFRKTIKRRAFTIVFGSVGKRRLLTFNARRKNPLALRFKMQMIRRSNQGWRNRIFGTISALQVRRKYGRIKSIPQFRR